MQTWPFNIVKEIHKAEKKMHLYHRLVYVINNSVRHRNKFSDISNVNYLIKQSCTHCSLQAVPVALDIIYYYINVSFPPLFPSSSFQIISASLSLCMVLYCTIEFRRYYSSLHTFDTLTLTMALHMSLTAIGGHLSNLRVAVPPPLRSICFPESLSVFLRNTILSVAFFDTLLFLSSFMTWSSRYLGSTTMLVSAFSLVHLSCVVILLGNHLVRDIPPHQIPPNGFVDQLKIMSARYNSPFAHGTAFGSTALMALLMHVVWAYFARVSDCVINLDNQIEHAYNITRQQHYGNSSAQTAIDNVNHLICGAYGPV